MGRDAHWGNCVCIKGLCQGCVDHHYIGECCCDWSHCNRALTRIVYGQHDDPTLGSLFCYLNRPTTIFRCLLLRATWGQAAGVGENRWPTRDLLLPKGACGASLASTLGMCCVTTGVCFIRTMQWRSEGGVKILRVINVDYPTLHHDQKWSALGLFLIMITIAW